MQLRALRGAITVEENEPNAILAATEELVTEVVERNAIPPEHMVSCIFTCTADLDAEFPAVAARNLGMSSVPLLCAREMQVPGSMPRVIRLLLHYYGDPDDRQTHVYLRDADLAEARPGRRPVTGIEFNRRIEDIPIYPAASTYAFDGELVKLASNETPYPPHPQVLEAVEAQLRTLNRYPDPEKSLLRRRISERTGVPVERVAVGNGSCEILLAAADAMLEPGAEIVYAWPAFSMYPQLAAMSGATAITVPLNDAGEHDLEAMAAQVTAATRLVIVCNPNNPSATALTPATIDAWVAELPRHVAVVVDEAYVEFSALQDPDDSLDLLERHPNLVLLRTFSKVYGLCGLRAGYALCPEPFRLAVDRVRQPFSVNALAQAAASEALNHQDEVERRVEQTVIERVYVESELAHRGLETTESQANFSWVSLGDRDEDEVVDGLANQGVIVRAGSALGERGRLRVTYGTRAENDRFLAALDTLL